ncbi:MAG TPA: hypothetical protein VIA18_10020 [Polyangia bacterium]|nr:hypothetical protein [Polyangia bacterium]
MNRDLLKYVLMLFLTWAMFGCSAGAGAPNEPPVSSPDLGSGNDGGITIPPVTQPTADYAGVYGTVTPIDLTQSGVLPGAIGPALAALTELHDHPGQAIVDFVCAANIPTLSSALNALPSFVRDLLAGLLDKLITDDLYANVPVADHLASIISGISQLANSMAIRQTLTVHTPDANGNVKIDQQLTSIGFTLLNQTSVVLLDADAQLQAQATLTGTITPHANAPIADADLTLAGGDMTLPLGQLMLDAASPLLFAPFGAVDLQGALTTIVPCQAAAQTISDGIDGLLSPSTIAAVCTAALDIVAGAVTTEIDKLVLTHVSVGDGAATLLDVSVARPQIDYQSDTIANGKWTWSFMLAGQSLAVPSTLAADRVGTAQ